jgi:hypothetical protein
MAGPGSRSQALSLSLIFVSIIIGLPAQRSFFDHIYSEIWLFDGLGVLQPLQR